MMIGKLIESETRCFLDNGTGNNRKGLWLSVDMIEDAKLSYIRFQGFIPLQEMIMYQVSFEKAKQYSGKWQRRTQDYCKRIKHLDWRGI